MAITKLDSEIRKRRERRASVGTTAHALHGKSGPHRGVNTCTCCIPLPSVYPSTVARNRKLIVASYARQWSLDVKLNYSCTDSVNQFRYM